MRKTILVFSIVFLIIINAGCTNKTIQTSKQTILNTSPIRLSKYSSIENGIYNVKGDLIYFFDEKAKKNVVLCNKPNCKHNNKDCSAFCTEIVNMIATYKNKLYIIGSDKKKFIDALYVCDLNGLNKKKISVLNEKYVENENYSPSIQYAYIYKNYIYISSFLEYSDVASTTEFSGGNVISRINLDTGKEEQLYFTEEENTVVALLGMDDDNLYFFESSFNLKDNLQDLSNYHIKMFEYDIKSKDKKLLFKDNAYSKDIRGFFDNKVYYINTKTQKQYSYDIEKKEFKEDFTVVNLDTYKNIMFVLEKESLVIKDRNTLITKHNKIVKKYKPNIQFISSNGYVVYLTEKGKEPKRFYISKKDFFDNKDNFISY